ncbi:ABC transporter ATP-binding protein [Mesorhizobium sp. M8A.F.Ca.ET.208.01.1.1]|nr:ABC transporter ATP-binding protein [Mesorhizobium sp. M8A.F.Ca.ET.021.01.1.1]RUX03166.1 ABC transporter ATP-binding protein [Mesorhizobium sp. M8A.F.Ca.ET.059.01.1.1]TGP92998.1 ABC transporter ATP-binding protein [Mesorhizobium sp. M8A.F.Ca.ET.218.01.1.1]TGQ91370.1 ABC transporter ATP-binding protein [Mesorhizobium sp. M8A.F.Ca.ET.208.01.1.1]TGS43235.1 ABC transporter ATP-binding protein [Mesorhizobium sp. M8A.F.Ca.ET.182.01.1.1]TGS80238.1 ABC transporter ATP-binding protein [Mesorhizobium
MMFGALAEAATLGALLPFLARIANPEAVGGQSFLARQLAGFRLTSSSDSLLDLTILFSVVAIIAGAVRIFLAWATNSYVFSLGHEVGVKVYDQVLRQPYSYHVSRNSSSVLAALRQVQAITAGVMLPLLQSISGIVIGVFIVAALFALSSFITFVIFAGFGAVYLAMSLVIRKHLKKNAQIIASAQAEGIRSVQEGLGGIRDVIINDTQPYFLLRYTELDLRLQRANAMNALAAGAPRFAIEAAGMVIIAALAYFLITRSNDAGQVLPILGTFVLGAQRLLPSMQLVYGNWALILSNLAGAEVVLQALEAPLGPEWNQPPPKRLPFDRAIMLKDVSFRYASDQAPILERFNLTISKGSKVGFIGKTGSGKSTTVDLIMGLLEPTGGVIEIDGQRLDGTTRRAWQRQIAHVPQSIFLADASIADNIAFGIDPANIDRDRVRNAAQQAALADFIESLPQGYETRVGERGVRLSGGQRQRIGIARALYRQASVLVFDEATSALDTETEAAVMEAIRELPAGLTVLIIAHRLTTVENCDEIVTLENGRPHIWTRAGGQTA